MGAGASIGDTDNEVLRQARAEILVALGDSGAAIANAGDLDKARAMELCGAAWGPDIEAQFDAASLETSTPQGTVPGAQVAAFFLAEGSPLQAQAAGCRIGVAVASTGDSLSKYLQTTEALLASRVPVKGGAEGETRAAKGAKASDMGDSSVVSMMSMIKGIPSLADQALDEKVRSATMSPADLAARHAARRLKIREAAVSKLAEFEALTEEERLESQNDGDASLYSSENQALREALFDDDVEVNRLLDKWWQAAVTYLDDDANNALNKDE
jgi:hypothetical protein